MGKEWGEYEKKKQKAERNTFMFCSLVVEGADQSAFSLSQFVLIQSPTAEKR